MRVKRRLFLKTSTAVAAGLVLPRVTVESADPETPARLPDGNAPDPVPLSHFPDRLHAFIWRNWSLVPIETIARVIGAAPDQVLQLGKSMGLPQPNEIPARQLNRSYITIIRRNWHLLPYEQLLELLGWTPRHMAYILREDDFLFIKLGSHKPKCPSLRYAPPNSSARNRAREIRDLIERTFAGKFPVSSAPLFSFVEELSKAPPAQAPAATPAAAKTPRFCYSYFALYGDPLLESENDPYPEGFLQRLAATGVNGVWLQAVLHKLAPLPWTSENEAEQARRLRNLRALAQRAAKHGIGIYLYLNEPRAMPHTVFESHPQLKGVVEGDFAAVCTSQEHVREAISSAISHVCEAVPELAGFFSISASENLTNCWSHGNGAQCPRCAARKPAEVIAEINSAFHNGIKRAGSRADLFVWDWGWRDEWAEEIIQRLPASVALMSVSEWSIPIERGGVQSVVGEYSISTIGPGPRATRHWELARRRGLRRIAKIQAGNTWELSATPYIPALENVARHVARLRAAGVDGLMLGWTLGGYPSPNLEAACEIAAEAPGDTISIDEQVDRTLSRIATKRFGSSLAPAVIRAWKQFSTAFSEFPFHGGLVYNAPMQFGPSNLLWSAPTGYRATMIGFPYDDLDGWRQTYPAEVFVAQFAKIADGFEQAVAELNRVAAETESSPLHQKALREEIDVASAAAIHFRSTANQARFVQLRNQTRPGAMPGGEVLLELERVLRSEQVLARQLLEIQSRDSRIGFEASNQYYYVPLDLAEKIVNCSYLLQSWLPPQ